ncbi:hypothetical protein HY990_01335 [Candidatus Micrarchaeota archaeon]|nr:hypothetical protein [Candidatus Micrarchaeota archaeon]
MSPYRSAPLQPPTIALETRRKRFAQVALLVGAMTSGSAAVNEIREITSKKADLEAVTRVANRLSEVRRRAQNLPLGCGVNIPTDVFRFKPGTWVFQPVSPGYLDPNSHWSYVSYRGPQDLTANSAINLIFSATGSSGVIANLDSCSYRPENELDRQTNREGVERNLENLEAQAHNTRGDMERNTREIRGRNQAMALLYGILASLALVLTGVLQRKRRTSKTGILEEETLESKTFEGMGRQMEEKNKELMRGLVSAVKEGLNARRVAKEARTARNAEVTNEREGAITTDHMLEVEASLGVKSSKEIADAARNAARVRKTDIKIVPAPKVAEVPAVRVRIASEVVNETRVQTPIVRYMIDSQHQVAQAEPDYLYVNAQAPVTARAARR